MSENISEIKKNVINWYPFEKNASILQIGTEMSYITEEIASKSDNIEIVKNEDIEKINTNKQFDYIILIGILEVYETQEKAYKKLKKILSKLKNNLKDNGKILLVIDNKYGMKFWTSIYAQKNILCNNKHALSKKMINEILDEYGLLYRKYYYLIPDYKFTNAIFTDKYLPTTNSILRNFTYAEDEFMSFNQTEAYQEILKEDEQLFKFFATSYFIEIAKNEFVDNNIKFVCYTNMRKEKYRIKTIMYEDKVTKQAINKKSKRHIEQIKQNIDIMKNNNINTLDSYDGDTIISKYIKNEKSYDEILLQYLDKEEYSKFFDEINRFKQYLIKELQIIDINKENTVFDKYKIQYDKKMLNKLTFIKHGLWDLIFQNTFYIEGKLYFYDQEWYEQNIPVEYIIYRTIAYFGEAHKYISRDEILERLNLTEFLNLFEQLDNKIQKEIRDEDVWDLHCRTKTGQTLFDLYNNLKIEFEQYKKEDKRKIEEKDEIIKQMENKIKQVEEKNNELLKQQEEMHNSTSWKITKPVRILGKYFK